MNDRILQEIELLQRRYGKLEYGPNLEWILFKEFKLPSGWNRDVTEILVNIPVGYPSTPPDNFFVPVGLRLASGGLPTNYTESTTLIGRQWGQFSYHVDGEWHPSANLLEGDNLLSFMIKIMDRLRELN